ncbi:MAG TPA: cyclic pyranopterin monophosphate synthase MoaC [Pseudomonadales bacterium]|nr:cyclic pyranopterin monophosphate synthase MoaC [Pseudomonadales bacterium]
MKDPDPASTPSPGLSHLDADGHARMVDVSAKAVTVRTALARACVRMASTTLALIEEGGVPKGDVLAVARVAGIMAAKRTGELIPLCHPLPLDAVSVDFRPEVDGGAGVARLWIDVRCATAARTGIEMEAMTAASVAALTVYDMCKAVEKGMVVESVALIEKHGGKSGSWLRPEDAA